jgi:hypothetical protein
MIIYEVNIDLHPSIAAEYKAFLKEHCRAMFAAIDGVRTATVCQREVTVPCPADYHEASDDGGEGATRPADWVGLTVSYTIATRAALDDYFAHRAGAMRDEAVQRFGTTKFRAQRRIMEVLDVFAPEP